jgi:hypothetical protein
MLCCLCEPPLLAWTMSHRRRGYPLFARSAQANDALTVDLNPLTIASSERILFKKPLLKSPLLTHYYK